MAITLMICLGGHSRCATLCLSHLVVGLPTTQTVAHGWCARSAPLSPHFEWYAQLLAPFKSHLPNFLPSLPSNISCPTLTLTVDNTTSFTLLRMRYYGYAPLLHACAAVENMSKSKDSGIGLPAGVHVVAEQRSCLPW